MLKAEVQSVKLFRVDLLAFEHASNRHFLPVSISDQCRYRRRFISVKEEIGKRGCFDVSTRLQRRSSLILTFR